MKSRIRDLEEQLSRANQMSIHSSVQAPTQDLGATHPHAGETLGDVDSRLFGETQVITRSVIHKSRMFGQSHWINGVIGICRDVFQMIEPHVRDDTSGAVSNIQSCKAIARVIKSRRTPPWPTPPTGPLPSKDVTDELVDCYLRTFETIYRVLHIPTFRRDYEALWVSDTAPDVAFMVQVKLVLAIGAVTYDEKFSLRASAIRWIYEAQTWLSEPVFKSRRSIQFLQNNILLLIARELVNVGGDTIWTSAGTLLRTAVYWGLHRDPAVHLSKRTTIFVVEMRRRLWNTILELAVHSSIASGAPPFISMDDFDTAPPENYDDDQLVADVPMPKPENELTQVSVAIALRKTFPLRLAITKFLNDIGSRSTYEKTLQLDAEFRTSYKTLCRTVQRHGAGTGFVFNQCAMCMVDCLMLRYLLSLHVPFFAMAPQETAYAFSRKVVVETSLRIWCGVHPSSSIMASHDATATGRNDFERLAICGTGFFRTVAMQACFVIASELSAQLQEEESLGPVPLRADLLSVIEDAKEWIFRSIEAGETNIKGFLLTNLIAAKIDGLRRGYTNEQLSGILVRTAEDVEARCLRILEEMAGQTEGMVAGLDQTGLNITPESLDDWDQMMTNVLLNQSTAEPMNWVFNEIPMVPLL